MFSQGFLSASSTNISCYVTGSSELLVPGRVTAGCNIPQGSVTRPIDPASLVEQPDVQQISVKLSPLGTIELDEQFQSIWSSRIHWLRALRLSDDCHSFNLQLKLQYNNNVKNNPEQSPKLILCAVRPIEMGQELQLWFSEDVLAMVQMAFLTPANIQGQKKYVCNRCSTLYESPNPLKLHITLGCGKFSMSTLWQRLSFAVNESMKSVSREEPFDFQIYLKQQTFKQKNAIDLRKNTENRNPIDSKLYRPYQNEPSAFKPFKKGENPEKEYPKVNKKMNILLSHCIQLISQVPDPSLTSASAILPNCFELGQHAAYNDEAQIESLVSSLGKSRQGHICLYCGKCYSRKYGLKIHIRTHTGYKPLKCKFCNRPFGDPSNLNKHVRLHAEGNTPYKCDLCGKILVRRRDLERHLKSRHMLETHPDLNIIVDSPDAKNEASGEDTKSETN
ncbi:zinc finger protein 226-like isoform X1 [Diorhabda carinulata]|uniref:zinc finger protein 226-like isoform X1 n=1 Tax=Diorhabda carinulata TaxID=1163345 RepID=UPI0025A24254|nr:zinc finger protein 226-like isoform X1 [Diorhabda carinulata]